MTDMNTIALTGRATKDAEMTTAKSGDQVAKFTLANAYYKKGAHHDTDTNWFSCVIIGKRAAIGAYIHKGTQLAVVGEIRQEKWEYEGKTQSRWVVYASNITLLGPKPEAQPSAPSQESAPAGPESFESASFDDEDIPF